MAIYKTLSEQQTIELGQILGKTLKKSSLILFTGDLGAGKTTFCKGIAKALGCKEIVNSPTFAIVNVYKGAKTFAHFDLYRITSEEDLETAGFFDYLESGAVVAAEWSENFLDVIDTKDAINVDIKMEENDIRIITIKNGGAV